MTIDEYLDQCEPGETQTRRESWSIPRTAFARKIWADAQPRWIECSERIPDSGVEVMAYGPNYGIGILFLNKNATFWDDGDYHSAIDIKSITHWMPLLESPK